MRRQALVAPALVCVYVAVALVARAERDHSCAEARSAFAAAGVRLHVVLAQQAPFEATVVERRANVLVLSDRRDDRVEAALEALE